jgi:purine nucleosidase
MPLDMTFKALFTAESILKDSAPAAKRVVRSSNLFSTFDRSDVKRFGRPGGPIHDATTIAWLIRPELFHQLTNRFCRRTGHRPDNGLYLCRFLQEDGPGGQCSLVVTDIDESRFHRIC